MARPTSLPINLPIQQLAPNLPFLVLGKATIAEGQDPKLQNIKEPRLQKLKGLSRMFSDLGIALPPRLLLVV